MRISSFALPVFIIAFTAYITRALPALTQKSDMKHPFLRSFLFYLPYATIVALIVPGILYSTNSFVSAGIGGLVAVFLGYIGKSATFTGTIAAIVALAVDVLIMGI